MVVWWSGGVDVVCLDLSTSISLCVSMVGWHGYGWVVWVWLGGMGMGEDG